MEGSIKREDMFVTTKIFHMPVPLALNHLKKTFDMSKEANLDVKKEMMVAFETSLDEMNLGYVDMLLMHWPGDPGSKDEAHNRRLRKECW